MASHAQDDGFHEIQLNGKQLVFLFMAATVVSVVIFLCGVLVGRGVRAERGGPAERTVAETLPAELPTAQLAPATATPAEADPTKAAPPPEAEDLTYFKRLEDKNDAVENLTPASRGTSVPGARPSTSPLPAQSAATSPRQPSPPARDATPAVKADVPARAPSPGFAVQVAALNARPEADAIAKRLAGKGYAAYVLGPASGAPSVYRVRVGAFKTRREAETIAARLQKEEQFKPWITR